MSPRLFSCKPQRSSVLKVHCSLGSQGPSHFSVPSTLHHNVLFASLSLGAHALFVGNSPGHCN